MDRIIISPSKYVQGNGALANIGNYVKALGCKPLILADAFVTKLVGDTVATSFHSVGITPEFDCFNGECSCPEIDRLMARCNQTPFDVIIGIGGGKTLDTAKSVAFYQKVPVVIVPTIASTDAPTSALAVIYGPKQAMLPATTVQAATETASVTADGWLRCEAVVDNPHGLHVRPAARLVAALKPFAAELKLQKGDKEANPRSLTRLTMLNVRQGDTLALLARGEDATAALTCFQQLAAERFGD